VTPEDTLATVHRRMKLYEVSQLPVIEAERLVGIIDESDLLVAINADAAAFREPVRRAMVTKVETIAPTAPLEDLLPIFAKDHVAVVERDGKFIGLITRIDFINHLRRRLG
jgi:cystathionine beta-synthase